MTESEARALLREHNLRSTEPRIQVLRSLAKSGAPVTYTELINAMGPIPWDPATVYRNLVKLSEANLCVEINQVGGATRYAITQRGDSTETRIETHQHPHFLCQECGEVACLPAASLALDAAPEWQKSVETATIQLSGRCPSCQNDASSAEKPNRTKS